MTMKRNDKKKEGKIRLTFVEYKTQMNIYYEKLSVFFLYIIYDGTVLVQSLKLMGMTTCKDAF